MKKKINELCGNDLYKICYPPTGHYPNCTTCPLRVKNINPDCPPKEVFYCIKDLIDEKSKLVMRLSYLEKILDKYDNSEIEVEEEQKEE